MFADGNAAEVAVKKNSLTNSERNAGVRELLRGSNNGPPLHGSVNRVAAMFGRHRNIPLSRICGSDTRLLFCRLVSAATAMKYDDDIQGYTFILLPLAYVKLHTGVFGDKNIRIIDFSGREGVGLARIVTDGLISQLWLTSL